MSLHLDSDTAIGMMLPNRSTGFDSARLNQRLADSSIIAGRMAHDFDNILTGIIGFADLLQPMLAAASQEQKFAEEIGKVGQRGMEFTKQLHQFSRSGQVKPQAGSVTLAWSREVEKLRSRAEPMPSLNEHIPANLPLAAIEQGLLQTVIGHLLANAFEAAATKVAFKADACELSTEDSQHYLGNIQPGGHVEILIEDNGSGIKPDVRVKLFHEPFFTTKVRHRGLGLAIVFRILYAHRGGVRIDAAAPPANGTIARVVVPQASLVAA